MLLNPIIYVRKLRCNDGWGGRVEDIERESKSSKNTSLGRRHQFCGT